MRSARRRDDARGTLANVEDESHVTTCSADCRDAAKQRCTRLINSNDESNRASCKLSRKKRDDTSCTIHCLMTNRASGTLSREETRRCAQRTGQCRTARLINFLAMRQRASRLLEKLVLVILGRTHISVDGLDDAQALPSPYK